MSQSLRFIDLFAGLGGFHQALSGLGHVCVFASELDPLLQGLYEDNYGIKPQGDIRQLEASHIPDHDVLCAGFPCQSFSKAGHQKGLQCETNGDLIDHVIRIIEEKKPDFIMLENVPNLAKHDGGRTYRTIKSRLEKGYQIEEHILSPHHFGIAQVRERLFIVGSMRGLGTFAFPEQTDREPSLRDYLQQNPLDAKMIPDYLIECIEVWQEFLEAFPKGEQLPSFPIWAMEFGADYPIVGKHPLRLALKDLRNYRGSFGASLERCTRSDSIRDLLPHYAALESEIESGEFPDWKVNFIRQNRDLYNRNRHWIDDWLPKIQRFPHSLQKLEWNCKGCERHIWDYVLQIRASGVRVKRATTAPSLIAMTTTQVPIIGWERRYMTPRECANLQCMDADMRLPSTPTRAYKALGNAVNVKLVKSIAQRLLSQVVAEPELPELDQKVLF